MAADEVDTGLIQDFLTEADELIEQLDSDLIKLEVATEEGHEAQAKELIEGIFRGLHTIKGSASFLAMPQVTTFAHAAEDALDKLRNGDVQLTAAVMDVLLRSVDVVRSMLAQTAAGIPVDDGPVDLVDELHAIAANKAASADAAPATGETSPGDAQSPSASLAGDDATLAEGQPLDLPPEKMDLLQFFLDDLKDQIQIIDQSAGQIGNAATCPDAAANLVEIADDIKKTVIFFDFGTLTTLATLLYDLAGRLPEVQEQYLGDLTVRIRAMGQLFTWQAEALSNHRQLSWPLECFEERVRLLIANQPLDESVAGQHHDDIDALLALDAVISPKVVADQTTEPDACQAETSTAQASTKPAAATASTNERQAKGAPPQAIQTEQTIRVEVGRLESLLNLVGQLVLSKNRFLSLSRKLRGHGLSHELNEDLSAATSELDHLTSELQMGVMRTRMQPLAKLFDRYPRIIRDLARRAGKKIQLEIVGKETEVDKSVLENLADPLVHILRNSADHGVEAPEVRRAAHKQETGLIRLSAKHEGDHVRVEIIDDGKGLDRKVIGAKAIERGMATAEQVEAMSDEEVFAFIFAAGFSTVDKISDLSGRGVGMDVVRSNLAKINGTVNLYSTLGQGTTLEILIPLTVAIVPAMIVGIGKNLYAIPLTTIIEIVRLQADALNSVTGSPVLNLRDSVLPLIDMRQRLDEFDQADGGKFAVVVGVGQQRAGLIVDQLIGQQEIVVKPLDRECTGHGPFSGATIREDGDVSLILDVNQLVRQAKSADRIAA